MRRALPLALALLFLLPQAQAAPEPEYPEDLLSLLPGWIDEAESLATAEDREKPWWPFAEGFLGNATDAADAGRLRVAMFHLETFTELVLAYQLIDESEPLGSDAERKAFVVQRTTGWKQDADRAWEAYRAKLHSYDGQLRSLQTIETALYSADIALTGALTGSEHPYLAREFPKQQGFPEGYVIALVRASHTPTLDLGWAEDILAKAVEQEGVPPRIVDERWGNLTTAALSVNGTPPSYMEQLDKLASPARENGESTLAVAFALAEQRAGRANGMHTIFGDARTRGLDVVRDASRGMNKQLNNTTLETPRSYGLRGVFTSDAIDRARFTNEFLDRGEADLGTVIVAWSGLEHASYAFDALAATSTVTPPTVEDEAETPFPTGAAILAALGIALLVARRRR